MNKAVKKVAVICFLFFPVSFAYLALEATAGLFDKIKNVFSKT